MSHYGRTVEQRAIAREIWRLRGNQKRFRDRWLLLDIQIGALEQKLTIPIKFKRKPK